ncbi:MFS transporter [Acetobacter orleanensis]|uniref:Uncharacterized MFS-type transporter AOR01nite_10060 n=1 Tax=Acetobacter orleanensis TaxID=104099 RepID=A0A4Y3TM65_9PROT|nr:MFS transporter [Acetobacter orleanensis]KXV62378.1 MFS transporter [Acetobacter orleanensis]PCD79403.1 MFS transporter [Acetobacter orleanensis]GAN67611.1 major facilitator superfamily transporter [Acetobacter orleanensis JCM 7639]GBR25279.1 major facilitator superfamily transporter [Acetobacter orleanensis NRIC 0473]GEB82529.1 UPF0226 protein [Acetobacter orleanensis]
MSEEAVRTPSMTFVILAVVVFTLFCYIDIGLQMAVVPLFVREKLGFSSAMAGFAVSVQYLATFASRIGAGKRIDTGGPKRVVLMGLSTGVLSGLLLATAGVLTSLPLVSLLFVLSGRIALGFAESWVATAVIVWNIRRAGVSRTAQVISWNGVCSYGGIALGAPIATLIYHSVSAPVLHGFAGVGLLSAVLMGIGIPLAMRQPAVPPLEAGKQPSFFTVLGRVLPYGLALAAGSVGFGAISAMLALYFSDQNWSGAAFALALFGLTFVLTRFAFTRQIAKRGGNAVAGVSLFVEALGLLVLAFGHSALWADAGAALTGAGFSLVFPALGVGAVAQIGPESKGAAIGAFSVCLDIAIGISGPLLGLMIPLWGYGAVFQAAACVSLVGVGLCVILKRRTHLGL